MAKNYYLKPSEKKNQKQEKLMLKTQEKTVRETRRKTTRRNSLKNERRRNRRVEKNNMIIVTVIKVLSVMFGHGIWIRTWNYHFCSDW